MVWMALSGLVFAVLNAILRVMALQMNPLQVQFLRYFAGLIVMIPFIVRVGLKAYSPNGLIGQLWRGAFHTSGMVLWYIALPHLTLADMTAIGFTGPIFIMIGAVLALGEKMVWERWVSALIGFAGVLIVVGPKMTASGGYYDLIMLASAPLFAVPALITKVMTRRDKPEVIMVGQCITISIFTFRMAIPVWVWPSAMQWLWFLTSGIAGSVEHSTRRRMAGLTRIRLRERWSAEMASLCATLSAMPPDGILKWAGPDMGVQMFTTARQMETWAHGQAIFDVMGATRVPADRQRNVAEIGVRTYG